MNKYKTKPNTIEAIKFTAQNFNEIVRWCGDAIGEIGADYLTIHTLEGDMKARLDEDYIIKGLLGEFYPCKVEAFEKKYEAFNEWNF